MVCNNGINILFCGFCFLLADKRDLSCHKFLTACQSFSMLLQFLTGILITSFFKDTSLTVVCQRPADPFQFFLRTYDFH